MATPHTETTRVPKSSNIPRHRNPPPPPPPKKQLWKRYTEGEKLQPTYEPLFKPIPMSKKPENRIEKYGADGFETLIFFGILILAMIVVGYVYSLK